jgi:DNA-binding beta-propeller fold protein YncE
VSISKAAAMAAVLIVCIMIGSPASAQVRAKREPLLVGTMPEQESVNLYAVDGPQLTLAKSIPVGKSPGRMCVAGSTLFVVTGAGAAAIDLTTRALAGTFTDPEIKAPFGCVVSPDAAKLYVTDQDGSAVFVFSTASRQRLKRISVPADPRQGIFTPDGKWLVVSCGDAGMLAVVDPIQDALTRTSSTIGLDPRSMVITLDGKRLVVALVSSDILSWYDSTTLEYVRSFGITRSPQAVVAAADGARLYVSGAYEGVISVVDLREKKGDGTPEPRQTSAIPVGPAYSLAASADGNYLYAAPTGGNGTVVDLRSWKVLKPAALKGAGIVFYVP